MDTSRVEDALRFADRLQELREESGLTHARLAEASGLSVGAIRNYEQGIREPHWAVVFKLSAAIGVKCSAFAESETTIQQ